jgi:Fe-S-cluster containining protein
VPSDPLKYHKKEYPKRKKELTTFLKKFDKQYIPKVQRHIDVASEETWNEVDCLACANCCKVMTPTFTAADLKRISAHFGMTEKAFFEKWLEKDPDNGDRVNRIQPCQFLDMKTNKCSIYAIRPEDCAKFPHFKRKPFADFNHIHQQNIQYCPATLLFISKMKDRIETEYKW